ncbi:hypothetical protein RHMOL_Rhmol04G0076900 [Rhododendron molle]|uniref:Uncharacterized protein n=1 Tax=Rhododendron molle TaxID=49168 RepID=A0ACC0NY55_RHOML|nr:hypothetical protein RHMOL_Rhmol04G0076900 [Rhododendron molle]
MFRSKLGLSFSLSIIFLCSTTVESTCSKGCDLALGSYYVWPGTSVRFIAEVSANSVDELISYNPEIPNEYYIKAGTRIDVPFSCDCIDGEFLAHVFTYAVRSDDTYDTIAKTYYSNLTTAATLERSNSYQASRIPDNAVVNVTVNCSCGNASVSEAYGLFVTYPLRAEDSLESIAAATNLGEDLLQSMSSQDLRFRSRLVQVNVWPDANLTFISEVTTSSIDEILSYNKDNIANKDFVTGRINVPLTCHCVDGEFLGHVFPYVVLSSDAYDRIAERTTRT